jgi:murein DD-endopeptidase MepM/ murein hydrolase activator NlpD
MLKIRILMTQSLRSNTLVTLLVSALAAVLQCSPLKADNIYKFQDKDGIWHFTDKKPDEGQEFDMVYMQKEAESRIKLRREGTEHNPVYLLFNDFWGPVEVEFNLSNAVNVIAEPELPARFVVPHQTEQALVGLGSLDPKRGFSYQIQLNMVPGPPVSQRVQNAVLAPPFALGESYPISQGFKGTSTHNSGDSEYALDIVMPVGTTILAAKAGVVMDIEEDFNQGGTDLKKFADKANHVRILHEDGTMAIYAHLDLASVTVRRGARVKAGQRIARSGNTGFSSGPHLHFALQQNIGMELVSLPFSFQAADGSLFEPQENQFLQGTQTGSY